MTPSWPPALRVAGACAAVGRPLPQGRPVPVERGRDGVDWVSAAPLRLAGGAPDQAVALATRLAAALTGDGWSVSTAAPGHLLLRLDDPTLADLAVRPVDWPPPGEIAMAGVLPAPSRSLADPLYAAQLAHARLCRRGGGGRDEASGAAPYRPPTPPEDALRRDVLVALADAGRVADRLREQGRPHHLLDWLATTGRAVVTWTDTSTPCVPVDPALVTALREALAGALRAAGQAPIERL